MFQALEEAIVVIKDGKLNFQNEIFKFILQQVGDHADETDPLHLKIFKIFRQTDTSQTKLQSHTVYKNSAAEKLYCLKDLMHRKNNYFCDKVFEIKFRGDEPDQAFRFVQIKVSKIAQKEATTEGQTERVNKILVQLIDVSDKMLYNEAKAEQQFVALINGAISHELRNPLNSIITEIMQIRILLQSLKTMLTQRFKIGSVVTAESVREFENALDGLSLSSSKMESATKFIDFFVHDILDYTLLIRKAENFAKNIEAFDIRTAVQEILTIFEHKIRMKGIQLQTNFAGFNQSLRQFLVKSDQKRI